MYKYLILFLSLFASIVASSTQASELSSQVDRHTISVEETLTLTISYVDGKRNWQPDLTPLYDNFEVISQNQSNSFKSTYGKTQSLQQWKFVIFPRKTGKLLIPSFKADNSFSDAIVINVTEATTTPKGIVQDVFLETYIDKSSVYVQEQVRLGYRLFFAVNVDSVDMEPLALDDVSLEELPEARYRKNINGKTYTVVELNYAIFPQVSTPLTIPALTWNIRYSTGPSTGFFNRSGRFVRKSFKTEEKHVEIKPIPDSYPIGETWLPSKQVDISQSWSNPPNAMKQGEPTTRAITLTAFDLMHSQLPSILEESTGSAGNQSLKIYSEQPESNNEKTTDGIRSTKIERASLVATQGGEISLPAIRLPWWDTVTDSLKYAEIPATPLAITGESVTPQTLAQSESLPRVTAIDPISGRILDDLRVQLQIWQILSATLALAVIALVVYIFKFARNVAPASNLVQASQHRKLKGAYQQLAAACRENQFDSMRKALIIWAELYWPDAQIRTLEDICSRTSDDVLKNHIRALDAVIYGSHGDSSWNGAILLSALDAWLKHQNPAESSRKNELAPLYGQ